MKLLKPGGKLVCIEYEGDFAKMDERDQHLVDFFVKYGALHGARQFDCGQFMATLKKAGFSEVKEYDWTPHALPSFRRLRRLARPVAQVVKLLGLSRFSINTIAASAYADWTEQGKFSFKAYAAKKTTRRAKK